MNNLSSSFNKVNNDHKNFQPFGLLGTSICHGQSHKGVARAYAHLEKMGFWKHANTSYKDFGALPFEESFFIYEKLFYKTSEIIKKGFRPALIGGDHSQSFATVSALLNAYPDLRIIWLDAHADINTPETSFSGNIHGMPIAGLMGLSSKEDWNKSWLNQTLKPDRLVYFGLRDLDEGEVTFMKKYNIENYDPQDIRKKGLESILKDISKRWKGKPVHLSFDIDALDSSLVPCTFTPVANGLNLKEALTITNWVKKELQIVSFEMAEFNPELAKTKKELEVTEYHVQAILNNLLSPV